MTDQELIDVLTIKIMGWETSYHADYDDKWWVSFDEYHAATFHIMYKDWNPLININHAMMFIEELTKSIFSGWNIYYALGWWTVSFNLSGLPKVEYSSDISLCDAICGAGLKVVGVK